MKIKFEGQQHSIDANTLIGVLTHYQTIIAEANKSFSGGSRQVSLNINAVEKGSFVIDVSIIQTLIEQIFSHDNVTYVASLTAIVGGIVGAYKKLKGRPAKTDEDKSSIRVSINADVSTDISVINQNIVNIYNQPIVREAISKSIEMVNEDPNVDGLSIAATDNGITTFTKAEFADYIYDDFDKEDAMPDERTLEKNAAMTIVGLNFEKGSKWQFVYDGFRISMIVKDDALMEQIDHGERFGKGDLIRVKLRIIQKYNKEHRAYENKSFKIVEFYEHVIPQKPQNMFE